MTDSSPESRDLAVTPAAAPEDQIGARIAQKRLAKGLNHDGLSKLTKLFDVQMKNGISRTTIRGYEVGLYKPGTREIRLLCEALEVSPNWLIFGGVDEADVAVDSHKTIASPATNELQKFIVALFLLHNIEAADRDVVYNVLHSLARLKMGENEYRAGILPISELGGILMDAFDDTKEGGSIDQEKLQELVKAYMPALMEIAQKSKPQP